ncbi:hypothetical protein WN48_02116 [Eufriesea mexicana]|nr:hypothetical protein WN48_02116 [Eufriesea mexicana]
MFAEFSPDSIVLCNEKFCYRDFNLLSFGGEAKEDEEESVILNKKFTGKGKSAHDHLTDPKLSSQPAVEPSVLVNRKRKYFLFVSIWKLMQKEEEGKNDFTSQQIAKEVKGKDYQNESVVFKVPEKQCFKCNSTKYLVHTC